LNEEVPPLPSFSDVERAARRIRRWVHRTPVMTCATLDALAGASLLFKCENLQRTGAFKYRGATNAVRALASGVVDRGVATHSSGNHAAALARAAATRGVPAWIVMPSTAPSVKRAAVEGYGGRVVTCEPTLDARESGLAKVLSRTGATPVHPYNDPLVIAGQGTAALELLEQHPGIDALVAPIGGGGLLSGSSLTVAALAPAVQLFGAEPEGADDARRSLEAGKIIPSVAPRTIADGLLTSLGSRTFAILSRHARKILTVDDSAILGATRLLWERAKLVVEPSGAVALAAVLVHREVFAGRRVGVIVSGGNLSFDERLVAAP
jgi:threonine dehydratase